MSDIVERLDAAGCTAGCNSSPVCLCALCQDAAEEFRALRARVAELEAALRDVMPLAAAHFLSVEERERIAAARRALGDDHGR